MYFFRRKKERKEGSGGINPITTPSIDLLIHPSIYLSLSLSLCVRAAFTRVFAGSAARTAIGPAALLISAIRNGKKSRRSVRAREVYSFFFSPSKWGNGGFRVYIETVAGIVKLMICMLPFLQ